MSNESKQKAPWLDRRTSIPNGILLAFAFAAAGPTLVDILFVPAWVSGATTIGWMVLFLRDFLVQKGKW